MRWPWSKKIEPPKYPCQACGAMFDSPQDRHRIGTYMGQPLYCDGKT